MLAIFSFIASSPSTIKQMTDNKIKHESKYFSFDNKKKSVEKGLKLIFFNAIYSRKSIIENQYYRRDKKKFEISKLGFYLNLTFKLIKLSRVFFSFKNNLTFKKPA
jgi:hypothetical protein